MALPDLEQRTLFEESIDSTNKGLRILYSGQGLRMPIETLLDGKETGIYFSPLPTEARILHSDQELSDQTQVFSDRERNYLLETARYRTTDQNGITTDIKTMRITRLKKGETVEELITKRETAREGFNHSRPSIYIVDIEKTGEFIEGYGPQILDYHQRVYREGRIYDDSKRDYLFHRIEVALSSRLRQDM